MRRRPRLTRRNPGDDQHAIIGYLLIGTDNTARKQIEKEQKKLDQRLRDELIGAPFKNYFTDPERAGTGARQHPGERHYALAERISVVPASELGGKNVAALITPPKRTRGLR